MGMYDFKADLKLIGVNPFVFVPDDILVQILKTAGKEKGPIPIRGTINSNPYRQTLVKYSGAWRLYVNTAMLKKSPKHIGEIINVSIEFDPESRAIEPHVNFLKALSENKEANAVFESLPASRKLEIVRYLANIKTEEIRNKNICRAINFLLGKERFIGREKPV